MVRLDFDKLEAVLGKCADVRIAVVGDLMLDVYLTGPVNRISPEAPVPVVQVEEERSALGGASNVAANVLAIGAACDVIGFVGTDRAGESLRGALAALPGGEMRPRLVEADERPTTTKTRVMARHQQIVRFDHESDADLPEHLSGAISAKIRESLGDCDVLVLEDYNKGVLTAAVIRDALAAAREAGVPVVVDPKFRNIFEYQGATIFKPNALELTSAMGVPIRPDDDGWLEEARERFNCEHLIVTRGEHGMVIRSRDGRTVRVPAVAREVYDVSGAGDTVTAFLAIALATGADIETAALIANFAAAIEVSKPGVTTVSAAELRELIDDYYEEEVIPSHG